MAQRLLPSGALAAVALLLLAGGAVAATPSPSADAARTCARPGLVGGKLECLRPGQRCRRRHHADNLKAGFVCRKVARKHHKRTR